MFAPLLFAGVLHLTLVLADCRQAGREVLLPVCILVFIGAVACRAMGLVGSHAVEQIVCALLLLVPLLVLML